MKRLKIVARWLLVPFVMFLLPALIYLMATLGRPAAIPVKRQLYEGVTYYRQIQYLPHSMIAHILVIDTKNAKGLQFKVTPPDKDGAVLARTTSQFLNEFGVQIAINGDGFFPWWSRNPMDYYPHVGDPVTPNGITASYGDTYADGLQDSRPEPTLYITRNGGLEFNRAPNKIFHSISGDRMLIQSGRIIPDLDDSILHPRTAIGTNKNGRWLYLIVVDGRQPFYSSGATFQELAEILREFDVFNAMALDGGGSSTMVIEGANGEAVILNSPIDNYIPGRERPVANHLGIFISK
jgi:hypothetical protein